MTVSVRQVQIQIISVFKYAHKYIELQLCIYEAICNSNKDIKFTWHRRKNAVSFWILYYTHTHTPMMSFIQYTQLNYKDGK
jgi:hypothetical protein